MSGQCALQDLDLPLERDLFLRVLVRELSGVLEDVVGYEEAAGFVSVVGQNVGEWLNALYREKLGTQRLSRQQVADVLVDLKARIQGEFSVVPGDDSVIVLENRRCPFGDQVAGRPSMCMMTSNVFGVITAENTDYAKVVLERTIAGGDDTCRVSIYLSPSAAEGTPAGREYFRSEPDAG